MNDYAGRIWKMVGELVQEKKRLDRAIRQLESMDERGQPKKTRGRKTMGDAERNEVSRRMRAYWVDRRAAKAAGSVPVEEPIAEESAESR